MEGPTFLVDDPQLAQAVAGTGEWPEHVAHWRPALEQVSQQLGRHAVEVISTGANQARSLALTTLVGWLPERTRRAGELAVRDLGGGEYEVQSESSPDQSYHVTFRVPGQDGNGEVIACECADFLYRGIPCKHLLAVAR